MSGGRLVVMDRAGRDVKRFPLASGLATLGSAAGRDIRVLLASVSAHHATVAVHQAQTVIRNVGDGETLVNGQSISVAALKHGDIITIGDRSLRWEYSAPNKRHQVGGASLAMFPVSRARGRGARRGSAGAAPAPRDRALQLAIELNHRASMPTSSGGKQVAIVQPQRRDTNEQTGASSAQRHPQAKRRSKTDLDSSIDSDSDKRKTRVSPKTVPPNTTKASMWIESRKWSPRRSAPAQLARPTPPAARRVASAKKRTPLRLAVLRKAQSAHKLNAVKIEAPLKIDHTKQAAIMLMTGHTPKSRLTLNQSKKTPTYVIKKPSPVRKTPGRKSRAGGRSSRETGDGVTPRRASTYSQDKSKRGSGNHSVTILEITDTTRASSIATRASRSPQKSPILSSPKKSALKDLSKKGKRKTESIKFDLSNLENHQSADGADSEESPSEDELTLHYSETSSPSSSPRALHSRGGRMLHCLGANLPSARSPASTLTPASPGRRSARGSLLVRRALGSTSADASLAFRTRTLSPRSAASCSVVDLVSIDSDVSRSVYTSAESADVTYGTPSGPARLTRSTLGPASSSTPYPGPATARRSKSLSTPENKHVSINKTRVSRASRSRSRINDSDLLLLDDSELDDSSPKTSRRSRTRSSAEGSGTVAAADDEGTTTPEGRRSPVEAGTPVLSIQSLLDASRCSIRSRVSTKGRNPVDYKRKTIGVLSEPKRRATAKSKSLGVSARQTVLRLSGDSSETSDRTDPGPQPDGDDTVTPRSGVEPVPEAVKNKHSTAKKPQSKRSIIDDLDRSDIVKQLFNSPVKRKLSQSMTEFSRRQLFDDDDISIARRPTRNTIALTGRSIDELSEHSGTFTPDRFVSPITTPAHSPNLSGIKRLFQKNTPENDLTNVRGVKSLLRTHRTRRSAKNDLTNVTGVKLVFANSPKNRLSDVREKEVFRPSPKNDLTDVRGVKKLFRKSPNNDLRNVSGVKRTFRKSPRNDLSDVRGVRKMYRNNKSKKSLDVSGVEELFNTSTHSSHNSELLFDQLVGKPPVKAVYSKTFSTRLIQKPKPKTRKAKSLHNSLDVITNNVEQWLEQELEKRFHRDEQKNSNNATKELNNLVTAMVDGEAPIRASRTRNSSMVKRSASEIYSAHTLPIKKRSLVEDSRSLLPQLPLKKRAVVHSTPMKGRAQDTMNASELGRVSPIPPVDKTLLDNDASFTRSTRQKVRPEEPNSRVSKAKTPQKTPSRLRAGTISKTKASPNKSKVASPKVSPNKLDNSISKRATRNRKNTTSDNTKKRRTSLVISKKAPVMNPKVDLKKSAESSQESPKKRSTRVQKEKVETPKRTRAKAQKATVVVPEPSPKLKPQAKGLKEMTKRTRKNTAAETESPKESQQRVTRGKGKENKTDNVERPKRGRKAATVDAEPPATKRGRGKEPKSVPEVKTRVRSVTKADSKREDKTQPKSRGTKIEVKVSVETEPIRRRGRKNTENISETQPKTRGKKPETPAENEPKTRAKKVETQSTVAEPVTRGRRTKAIDNVVPETKGRKRKTVVVEEVPAKITKRGKKNEAVETEAKTAVKETAKTRAARDKSEIKAESRSRGRPKKVEVAEEVAPAKATRGKKVVEPKKSPVADKQKRKTKVEASPTKGKKQSPVEAKKTRNEPPTRARAARGLPQQASTAAPASGRSRRR